MNLISSVGEEPYFMVLAQNDGLTQDELTKIVKVDKAATARRIRSLEKKKLFFEKLTLRIKGIKTICNRKITI